MDCPIKPLIYKTSGRTYLKNILLDKLDDILIRLTRDYTHFLSGVFSKESKEAIESKQKRLASIAEFALFVRQIAPLSMQLDLDTEFESKDGLTKEAAEWAYSIFQYSDLYGYRQTIKGSIKF